MIGRRADLRAHSLIIRLNHHITCHQILLGINFIYQQMHLQSKQLNN